jgi:hypothetical protein
MAFSSSALRRLYTQLQTVVGTIINTGGTWNSAAANLVPHVKIEIKRITALIEAEYKTGTSSMLTGVAGKNGGTFSGEADIMPSGAAGTAPNTAHLLANMFGAPGTVVAATSVTYNLTDQSSANAVPLLTAAVFNETASTLTQQFGYGGLIQNYSIGLGGNGSVRLTFDGQFFYVLETDNWANEDSTGKAGLTTSPTTQPASPALVGNIIPSFAATVTFAGTATVEFRSATVKGTTGRSLRMDGVGFYPDTSVSQGRRKVTLSSLKFQDSDGAGLQAVKNAIRSKAAMNVVITQGNVAGYILTHTLDQVQFTDATLSEDGDNISVDFGDAPAHATALANTNEYTLALT